MNKLKLIVLAVFPLLTLSINGALAADPGCYDMDAVACETFKRTNAERRKNRLPAMSYCERCFDMAQEQSEDMLNRDYFSHTRPVTKKDPGESFSRRAARFGLSHAVAENIAQGGSPKSVVGRWMKSKGHRKNILNRKYDTFAVGFRGGYYTQVLSRERD